MSVQNFGSNELTTNTEIPSYSFVTADTLGQFVNDFEPGRNDFASGVVAYNGILTSGDKYFTVTKEGQNVFNIEFKNPYDQSPTVLIFPSWTRVGYVEASDEEGENQNATPVEAQNDGSRPRNILDVNFGINFLPRVD